MTTAAVLGTGRMGSGIARSLTAKGVPVILYNRTRERCAPLAAELGARVADTAADAASAADVSLSMVSDEGAVEDLYGGPDGILAGARAGSVLVDLSTVPPRTIRGLEPRARAAGVGILDAPVSGSVATATSGQLTLMVGGAAEDLERARPVLDCFAGRIFHIGPLGTGAAMKLAINAVIFGLNGAVSEGLALAERAGIDRSVAYEVIAAGATGAPYVGYKRASFLDPEGTPTQFSLALAEKDLRLIVGLAAELAIPLPQSVVNLEVIRAASEGGRGDRDFATVAEHLRDQAAVGAGKGGP